MTDSHYFSSSSILSSLADGFPIYLDGETWKSTEHYYQFQKFKKVSLPHANRIKNAHEPALAQFLGNSSIQSYPKDAWRTIKYGVMYRAQLAKFSQNPEAKKKLLRTGSQFLIYYSSDPYWGNAKDNSGRNCIGIILMKIRDRLKG